MTRRLSLSILKGKALGLWYRVLRLWFYMRVRHLHGPKQLDVAPGDVVLIALIRDGAYYLDAFFAYYRAIGVKHFVFFDNGSTDGSIARIKAEPGTVIDQARVPLAKYEDFIRQYPANTYGKNRWCLYVDMDEVLDFEGRAEIGLKGLVQYLEAGGYTAFAAQMLEMFPKGPLQDAAGLDYLQALAEFSYYDISSVAAKAYHAPDIGFSAFMAQNRISNDALKFLFGGVRGRVFGEACCLTKHPLIFNGYGVVPAPHPHVSMGVHVADVTGVIQHYKFANDAFARDKASQASGDLGHGEDSARVLVQEAEPDVTLYSDTAQPWDGLAPLVADGFVLSSDAYRRFVKAHTP